MNETPDRCICWLIRATGARLPPPDPCWGGEQTRSPSPGLLLRVMALHHCLCAPRSTCAVARDGAEGSALSTPRPSLLGFTEGVRSSAGSPWWSTSSTARAPPVSTRPPSGGTPHGTECPRPPCSPCPGPPRCPARLTGCSASRCSHRPRPPSHAAPPLTGSCPTAPGKAATVSSRAALVKLLQLELQRVRGTFMWLNHF